MLKLIAHCCTCLYSHFQSVYCIEHFHGNFCQHNLGKPKVFPDIDLHLFCSLLTICAGCYSDFWPFRLRDGGTRVGIIIYRQRQSRYENNFG